MLAIFPASSLDASILTSVLVGLVVMWFFQETLGWTFTGLVVPGYLATILMVQPAAGLAVTLEAVATWGIVLAVSDHVPRWWPWTPLFGRDRFLAFLLVSVGVRVLFESGGLEIVARAFGLTVDPQAHALGLVVVPLMAHAMWRSGLPGLPRIGIPILLTWAALRWVVLAETNLSLSSFALSYEDLAGEFVSSPRHYILLLVGATLGSIVNLRWGSDFGGLIVPGLLALCWLQPDRLAATVGEAIVIAALYRGMIRLPGLRSANLTGGRPLVLAYCIGYALKFVLGWTVGGAWPGFDVRSLFGFGYILSSLLALRLVKHGEIARSMVPALGTSLVAVVVGQAVAALLAYFLGAESQTMPARTVPADPAASLRVAALTDEGAVPTVDLSRPGFWTGGAGFGGLVVRDGASPILVRARVGEIAIAEAALRVAEAIDARAVQLCARDGDGCDDPPDGLTVVTLADGPEGVVAVPAGAPNLDIARLTPLTGPLRLEDARDGLVVRLPVGLRLALAADGLPGPEPWMTPGVPVGEIPTRDAGSLRALQDGVVGPMMAWTTNGSEEAATLAAARAPAFGLVVRGGGEVLSLRGPGWAMHLTRGGRPMVVDVPSATEEEGALRFGLSLARQRDAVAVIVRAQPAEDGVVDDATVALATVVTALGASVEGVTIRGVPQQRDPGVDLVLSRGRTVDPAMGEAAPAWLAALTAAGFTSSWFDGTAQRAAFAEGANAARILVSAAAGPAAHVTMWVRAPSTERLRGVETVPSLASAPMERVDVAWSAIGMGVAERHALDGRRDGARAVACDALLGCRWILERGPDGAVLLPLAPPTGAGDPRTAVAFSRGAVAVVEATP